MMGKLLLFVAALLCVYITIVLLTYFFQARLVFFPTRSIDATPLQVNLKYEDVWLQTEDGKRVHGWYVAKENARWTVLMFHGNGGNISHRLPTLSLLHAIGVNTLLIDYRGYGLSEGRPSEQATYLDAMAAWQYLVRERSRADAIIIFGRSLGGAVAMWLADKVKPRGLILESTFTSLTEMAEYHYPFLPVRYIVRMHYDSMSIAGNIQGPTFVLHSRSDEIVPFELGVKLYDALSGSKSFLEIQGSHNDGFFVSDGAYKRALSNFFDSL